MREESLKALVYKYYFSKFGYEPNYENIDFVIVSKKTKKDLFGGDEDAGEHLLWAESKKGSQDIYEMFTQLILTCKKTYDKAQVLAPSWLGVFDNAKIAFVSFHEALPIFNETDFNWNQTPSNHKTADFQKSLRAVKKHISGKVASYKIGRDDAEIKEFVKTHFISGGGVSIKSPITKDNFVQIFIKWVKEVKPFINVSKDMWADFKKNGILDYDFYRADLMSSGGNTITEKLKIVLQNDNYKFQKNMDGMLFTSEIGFTDGSQAYRSFWNKYERPPAQIYQQYIIDRRDLLVPPNIREVKGSFFTPKIWADLSKKYLADVFGAKWQDEYYIWDCAAGSGTLLAGLSNPYNVWASDIDAGNVETMRSLIDIDESLNLLDGHIFQFDFLNDGFEKLPDELKKIISDKEKRKKLIVYINPPYAEDTNKRNRITTSFKGKVAQNSIHNRYASILGKANHEVFAQFLTRIYKEIPEAAIANFSTLKNLQSPNFKKFRVFFLAKPEKIFIVPADTFDNVAGQFPIGFFIWNTGIKDKFKYISADVYDREGNLLDVKNFYDYDVLKYINDWIKALRDTQNNGKQIGVLNYRGNDFQHESYIFINNSGAKNSTKFFINESNLIEAAIYLSVRKVIPADWLNDRDQFLYPNDKWEKDIKFQNDCLAYTLFNTNISCKHGINHWLPFTESEVGAKEKFESSFMSGFLKGRNFSAEAKCVLEAGRELWKYYHGKIKDNKSASVNASFYDIREYFQGRKESGTMNAKSDDETYNALIAKLRSKQKKLAEKIAPKVYEFGFLKS